jgi:ubiquinone/menaquinone biosynthesis C-methylase UbiE
MTALLADLRSRICAAEIRRSDERGMGARREQTLAGLQGRVIDVGAGSGATFGHYPADVTEVLAVEPDAYLRGLARKAAADAAVPVTIAEGVAEALPADDESFDAAVAHMMLCSVHDLDRAAGELYRVVRPGGEVRFNEHVISRKRVFGRLQRAADATIWPRVSGGCHLGRNTVAAIRRAGFVIDRIERFRPAGLSLGPPKTFAIGIAHRP